MFTSLDIDEIPSVLQDDWHACAEGVRTKLRTGHAKVLQDATGASSFAQVGIASRMSLRSAPGVSNVGAKGFFMNCSLIFLRRVHRILKFM